MFKKYKISKMEVTKINDNDNTKNKTASKEEESSFMSFWFLVIGIFFFFGCHNYMQELIMSLPGFKIGIFLGYLEVLGVTICTYIER